MGTLTLFNGQVVVPWLVLFAVVSLVVFLSLCLFFGYWKNRVLNQDLEKVQGENKILRDELLEIENKMEQIRKIAGNEEGEGEEDEHSSPLREANNGDSFI